MAVVDLTENATQSIDVLDPATGALVGRIPAAHRRPPTWPCGPRARRSRDGPAPQANAQAAWRELEVGTVKVNAVFGGAPAGAAEPRRRSGHGFGYGPELLDEVTHTKVVHLAVAPPAS
jgi:hypothetical protein